MQIFIHRVNTLEKLSQTPPDYGVEIDIRGYGEKLFLHHEPLTSNGSYLNLEDFLIEYKKLDIKGGIILNTKEAGYESQILGLMESYQVSNYFLLDVEFPYLYRATRLENIRTIAVRFSEAEPIEAIEAQMNDGAPLLDWVWIDTNTKLPLNQNIVQRLKPFKTCLVCPERWGRPDDIEPYIKEMAQLGFEPNAVMTSLEYADTWKNAYNTPISTI